MNGQELTKYEVEQLERIEQWEQEEPSVVSQAVGFVTKPLAWVAQKIIPEKAIRGALDLSNATAQFLADSDDLLRDAKVSSLSELKELPLERLDELADEVHNWAIALATAEGAGTGAGGVVGMAIDVPLVITIALRTIHKIGLCYGYECKDEVEAQFVYAVLSASGANSVQEKVAALTFLQQLRVLLVRQTWKSMAEKMAATQVSKEGALIAIRNLAKQLGINLTKRKALQVVPIVGAAVGASVNGWWLKEVGWAARRSFQKRWLEDHGKVAVPAAA